MSTAQVVTDNGHQSVRLPAEIRIDADEVGIKRIGRSLLLVPKDSDRWQMMLDSLQQFTDDYMDDRTQPHEQERGPLFE